MRNILLILFITISLTACKKKDYVSLEIKIDNLEPSDSVLSVIDFNMGRQIKNIILNKNGVFKDTFKLQEKGFYGLMVGAAQIQSFLENGYDLKVNGDAKDLTKTLNFKGNGANNSNYLIDRIAVVTEFSKNQDNLMKSDSASFNKSINEFENKIKKMIGNKKLDTMIVNFEKKGLEGYLNGLKQSYNGQMEFNKKFGKGKPSPKFVNYENFKGGKTSLDDFKGKFVYIDVWATWCKPCIAQIPALKELEKEYRGKNIVFVSISSDRKEDYNKWVDMVKKESLEGVQLYFGEDMTFMQEFQINSIPRFILLDPNGNIVDANAPRPSEKEMLKKLFEEIGVN